MDTKLFNRATALMLLDRRPLRWNQQADYENKFFAIDHPLRNSDLQNHLFCQSWVACRLPDDGLTDRIVIDIDFSGDLADRDERYWTVREVFGRQRRPLVWSTPSILGIRLAYRIPVTPMTDLVDGADADGEAGLLPGVLRAAGISPGRGRLEIYPAENRSDRQLFGSNMPLLDPDTLKPIPEAEIGSVYSQRKLRGAVELVEEWHGDVQSDLIGKLRELPRVVIPAPRDIALMGPDPEIDPDHGIGAPADLIRQIREGLVDFHTRYSAEFRIGTAIWLWPHLFHDIGLCTLKREEVARTLAKWLSERANGKSEEWSRSVALRGPEAAEHEWIERYLRRNREGLAPVDRMQRAAAAVLPGAWPTCHLTPGEHESILRMARRARWSGELGDGAEFYRFAVWASTFLRVAKRQMRRGGASGDMRDATAQIAAAWQKGWPYGKAYVRYREILVRAGLLKVVEPHRRGPVPDVPGKATVYRLADLEWCRVRDLPLNPNDVRHRIASLAVHHREVTDDEAYHALWVVDSGLDAARIFGRRSAERIHEYLHALRPPSPLAGF